MGEEGRLLEGVPQLARDAAETRDVLKEAHIAEGPLRRGRAAKRRNDKGPVQFVRHLHDRRQLRVDVLYP